MVTVPFFYIVFFLEVKFAFTSCFLQGWEKGKVAWLSGVVMTPGAKQLLLFFFFFINLFLAARGLYCCAWAFSSCGERGLLFVAVCGLLTAVASLVAEHEL